MFDYIIIGAGSAGCTLANRLTEDPNNSVLLLEAGEKDSNPFIHIPAGIFMLFNHKTLVWPYWTEPEPGLKNRKIYWPRGKTLGGCSSIHGMAHTRGHRKEYDEWAALGNNGWAWKDVLPYFKSIEAYTSGGNAYRGDKGEMEATAFPPMIPLVDDLIASAANAGIPLNKDYNGEFQEGVSTVQRNVLQNGRRLSCARAFLKPVLSNPNLNVETDTFVNRIEFDGRRATAVEYRKKDGTVQKTSCGKEIVLCTGAINSPQLLQLSGIGPGDLLQSLGIDVVCDLPGVGENLQDHLWAGIKCRLKKGVKSLNNQIRPWKYPFHFAKWLVGAGGVLTITTSDVFAFVKSNENENRPDLQIAFRTSSFSYDENHKPLTDKYGGFTFTVYHVRPKSTGSVKINSTNPVMHPTIRANYLSHEDDMKAMLNGLHITRKILDCEPIAGKIESEVDPGRNVDDDEGLADYVRETAESVYHPVSTCRMGTDGMSVVDERLRVRGVDGLRVVDASVMPFVTAGNTNIPTVMIAAKAADMIREDNK